MARIGYHHSKETIEKIRQSNTGRKLSMESRKKISLAQLGKKRKPLSEETKQKIRLKHLGKKLSPEHILKMSIAKKGKPGWNTGKHWSEEMKKKLSMAHLGHVHTEDQKKKISKSCSETWNKPEMKELNRRIQKERIANGTHNLLGIIKIRQQNARIDEYDLKKSEWKALSRKMKIRDGYTCQSCHQTLPSAALDVHHIVPYIVSHNNKENNLVTLCKSCHASIEYFTKLALSRAGGGTVE